MTLLHEGSVVVKKGGKVITRVRFATRVLRPEGRASALAAVPYMTDGDEVKDFEAWLIHPDGEVKRYRRDDVLDLAAAPNDVYNEARIQTIDARGDAGRGSVFGFEWELEGRALFTQREWGFQGRDPVVSSRFSLELPEGWRASGVTFNHPPILPVVSGSRTTWELRDLPFIPDEPASPPVTSLAPRLAVDYRPEAGPAFRAESPGDGGSAGPAVSFRTWMDVSAWLRRLAGSRSEPTDVLLSKARELVSGTKSEWERIERVGRLAQGLGYISVQTGLGRGGGYRPHEPGEVLAKGFGDCKDKANLMTVMLRALGFEAYFVAVYAGDPTYVREEWPSPQQFNHAIVAVRVPPDTRAPAAIDTRLGRLLFFDPTDALTPLGALPEPEQGGLALVVAGESSCLLRLPFTPPEENSLEGTVDAALLRDGSLEVELASRATGSQATARRDELRSLARRDYDRAIEGWLARLAPGIEVTRIEPEDGRADGSFRLGVSYRRDRHAQPLSGGLLLVKPFAPSGYAPDLAGPRRTLPIVLSPQALTNTVTLRLPAGHIVEEPPEPVLLQTAFGSFRATVEATGRTVTLKRTLLVRRATLPASEIEAIRGFFERVRSAEGASLVLRVEKP